MALVPNSHFRTLSQLSIALWFALAVLAAAARASDDCDPSISSVTSDPLGYRQRGERCEGIYWEPHSARDRISIVSYTSGDLSLATPGPDPLSIKWPADAAGNASSGVHVRVTSLSARQFFRMDAMRSGASGSFPWPTDVLRRLSLNLKDLGFIGETTEDVGGVKWKVNLPLAVGASSDAPGLAVVLMATAPVRGVNWGCLPIDDTTGLPGDRVVAGGRLGGSFEALEPIPLGISFPDFSGLCYLKITTEAAGFGPGNPLANTFVIRVPARSVAPSKSHE